MLKVIGGSVSRDHVITIMVGIYLEKRYDLYFDIGPSIAPGVSSWGRVKRLLLLLAEY